jgi:hypothetical protein
LHIVPVPEPQKSEGESRVVFAFSILRSPRVLRKVRSRPRTKVAFKQRLRKSVLNRRSPEVQRRWPRRERLRRQPRTRECRALLGNARETRAFSLRQIEPEKFRDDTPGGGSGIRTDGTVSGYARFFNGLLASERLQRPAGVALDRGCDVLDDLFLGHFSER